MQRKGVEMKGTKVGFKEEIKGHVRVKRLRGKSDKSTGEPEARLNDACRPARGFPLIVYIKPSILSGQLFPENFTTSALLYFYSMV